MRVRIQSLPTKERRENERKSFSRLDKAGRREEAVNASPCIICGRLIVQSSKSKSIRLVGNDAVSEDEIVLAIQDQGYWPIGPECLRKHPELKKVAV